MTRLSIIVPGFNCERTLEEAVASIFRQSPVFPFDVTMVDDGSTDSTYDVMQGLARKYPHVKVVRHASNRGGGAARNTAVAHSDGDLIFCVDGDDILGPGFLERMTAFWRSRKCHAVGMSTSIKFHGSRIEDVEYVTEFEGPGKPVRFESFLDGMKCSLMVVFMMTRAAFSEVGGYPTEHGFDTQGMGFRFLCHGLDAYTCPETVYYHRVGVPTSYYRREQQSGRLNWNWFNLLEEFLYLFRDEVKVRLLEHDLFEAPGSAAPGDLSRIVRGTSDVYTPAYRALVRKGPARVAQEFAEKPDAFKQYWVGNFLRSRGQDARALQHFARALTLGFDYRIVYYRMLQAELALAGNRQEPSDALLALARYSEPYPLASRPLGERLFHHMAAREILRQPVLKLKALRDSLRRRKAR